MGSLTRKLCGCGRPAKSMGLDGKGRRMYRSQCWACREEAHRHRKNNCEWCFVEASDEVKLDVDHIDGNTSNNHSSNLQTLCRPCHIIKTKIFGDYRYSIRQKTSVLGLVNNDKNCGHCNKILPLHEFNKNASTSDGYQAWCKACLSGANKKVYEKRKQDQRAIIRTSKTCLDCKQTKPVSQFGKKAQAKDKLLSYCKPCWTKRTQRSIRKNKK